MENNNKNIENKIFLSIKERVEALSGEEINKTIKNELKANGYEDWQVDYATDRIKKMIYGKKDISEIKKMFDLLFNDNPAKFEEMLNSEKQLSGEVDLIISGTKVIDTKRDLIGNVFITNKNIYFITTKISNLPENLPAFYSGGVLFGLIGEVINKLTNEPKTIKKTDNVPLNILAKYIDGSFKIDLLNILLVRINNKDNHFVFKTKDKNQWSHNFFVANSEDREKIQEILQRNNIKFESAKGLFQTLIEIYKKKK